MFVLLGPPGLRLRLLPDAIPLLRRSSRSGFSIRSKRLRPGLTAVSNGLRTAAARPLMLLLSDVEAAGAVGVSVNRIGWPLALAPSNSRIAERAS